MSASLGIPPKQNFSCSGCGDCCRELPVPLSDKDIKTIEGLNWKELVAEEFQDSFYQEVAILGRQSTKVLKQRPQGAGCVFLGDDNLCKIHGQFGSEKKPYACRAFPFQFIEFENKGKKSFVSPHFVCKSVAEGSGAALTAQKDDLKTLNKQVSQHFPVPDVPNELSFSTEYNYKVALLDQLNTLMARAIDRDDLPFSKRLLIVTRFADLILSSKFKSLDHPKRADFIETLFKGTSNHVKEGKVLCPTVPPDFPERILFRQILGFRTLDHSPVFFGEGARKVAGASLSRFLHGFWWMVGWGSMEWPWPPKGRRVSMAQILSFAPKITVDDPLVDEALTRYFSASFHGRKLFEINLRKRTFVSGLGLLLRQVPAIVLFARASALSRDSDAVEAEDMTRALRLADLSFGLFPFVSGLLGSVRRKALTDMRGPWFHLPWVCA